MLGAPRGLEEMRATHPIRYALLASTTAIEEREGASTTQVPPFALFELVDSRSGNAAQSNNAKSGTRYVEARSAHRILRAASSIQHRAGEWSGRCTIDPASKEVGDGVVS